MLLQRQQEDDGVGNVGTWCSNGERETGLTRGWPSTIFGAGRFVSEHLLGADAWDALGLDAQLQ
jgi:hypothetical protein